MGLASVSELMSPDGMCSVDVAVLLPAGFGGGGGGDGAEAGRRAGEAGRGGAMQDHNGEGSTAVILLVGGVVGLVVGGCSWLTRP